MKLVVDSNIIISALINNGITRRVIFSPLIQFITPEYTLEEILKYENLICKKAKLNHNSFHLLLNIIFADSVKSSSENEAVKNRRIT